MRFGLDLGAGAVSTLDELAPRAALAEELGFDLLWIEPSPALPAALVVAAALATATATIRIAAVVDAGFHPVNIAEDAAVADLSLGGRLVLVLRGDGDVLLAETVDVVHCSFASRPFEHAGPHWTIPAGLPDNADADRRVRVTPAPAQLELPVWLAGSAAPGVARERALAFVAGDPAHATVAWAETDNALGAAALRLSRPVVHAVAADESGGLDADGLVEELAAGERAWGQDTAIVALPDDLGEVAWARAARTVVAAVRPRLQLDRLPDGLEEHWREMTPR